MASGKLSTLMRPSLYWCLAFISVALYKEFFRGSAGGPAGQGGPPSPSWGTGVALLVLVVSTVFIAWMSEVLVGSVEQAAGAVGMSKVFVGVIVVAIVGNAAEHSTAVMIALKNCLDALLVSLSVSDMRPRLPRVFLAVWAAGFGVNLGSVLASRGEAAM